MTVEKFGLGVAFFNELKLGEIVNLYKESYSYIQT